MAARVFLDANILIDYTNQREFHISAKQILELVINQKAEAFITSSVLHIVSYWTSKVWGNNVTKNILLTLLSDLTIIDIPHQVALTALHSKIDDIEDALQYYTAIHHKMDYFISRDKRLQKEGIPVLPVYTPAQFLKQIS